MNKINNYIFIIVLLLVSSCRNKDICPDCFLESAIEVKFNWSEITDIPKGMRVNFYNQDGSLAYSFNLPSTGGTVRVSSGDYKVFCFNNDSEYIMNKDQSNLSKLTFYTRQLSSENGPLFKNPDHLCTALLNDQIIKSNIAGVQVVTLKPVSDIANYTYQIGKIENGKYITGITASLSGLRSEYTPSEAGSTLPTASMPFNNNKNETDKEAITGDMKNFGVNTDDTENILTLTIYHKGGPPIKEKINVTNQVKDAPDPYNVHIIINKDIIIPTPIVDGDKDGVDPSVEDWIDVDETIYL